MEKLKFISEKEISSASFFSFLDGFDYILLEEDFVKYHQQLIGKFYTDYCSRKKDCAVSFIRRLLDRDYGRSIVYNYRDGAKEFIASKYLSDYFKNSIKQLADNDEVEIKEILESNKLVSEMTCEELTSIYSFIKDKYTDLDKDNIDNVASCFITYLHKLESKDISLFFKNNFSCYYLSEHILNTSGLSTRASYYSGRGVNYGDLNEENLVSIFEKLLKIDVEYAFNFVQMVQNMKTLGATEFITSFKGFAANGFKNKDYNISESNVSLDGVYDDERFVVALASFGSLFDSHSENMQVNMSNNIKRNFIHQIKPILKHVAPEMLTKSDDSLSRELIKRK